MTFLRAASASAGLVVALSALTHLAFLGWDTSYDVDPLTGAVSGPYESWQVVGCGAALIALAVLTVRRAAHRSSVFLMPATFTLCWALQAANSVTDDGSWPVGAIGTAFGTSALAGSCLAILPPGRRA